MEAGTINPTAYAEQLLAQMGTSINLVPETVLEEVKRKKSKTGVNEVIIPWFTAHKQSKTVQSTLDDAAKIILKNMGTRAQSQRVEQLRSQIASDCRYLEGKFNDIRSYSRRIFESRSEIDFILGKPSDGVLPYVEQILAKGWYTLDIAKTEEENAKVTEINKSVWFKTPLVYMAYYNPDQNINVQVKMQEYWVQFKPSDASVRVFGCTPAFKADGYCHPHISSSNDVCWGNGASAMQQTIKTGDPGPAFEALKVILTTYNSESPYVQVGEFMKISGMDLTKLPTQYVTYDTGGDSRILINMDNVPEGCQRCFNAEDEIADDYDLHSEYNLEDYAVVSVYMHVYQGTDVTVDDKFYFKVINGASTLYVPVNENLIKEWVY